MSANNSSFLVGKLNSAAVSETTSIEDLNIGQQYRIISLKKITTKYGPTLQATIEDFHIENTQPLLAETYTIFLPKRYAKIATDEELDNYNGNY